MSAFPPPDARFMAMALRLAARGLGRVAPNPSVGCVVTALRDDAEIVVGRGATGIGGRPHAERVALDRAGAAARGGRAYVTLEPCCHHGLTPPCADALAAAGIVETAVACADPDARVSGGGLARLREAGVRVVEGMMADEARALNAGFFSMRLRGRPYVTLKLAASLDGAIAERRDAPTAITGPEARRFAHLLRARADAVWVGAGTARADDPRLDCRLEGLESASPRRVVASATADLPLHLHLFSAPSATPTLLLTTETAPEDRLRRFADRGVEIAIVERSQDGGVDPAAALRYLAQGGITRLLVEGGARLAGSLLAGGWVDELAWFTAPRILGASGVGAVHWPAVHVPERTAALSFPAARRSFRFFGGDGFHGLTLTSFPDSV